MIVADYSLQEVDRHLIEVGVTAAVLRDDRSADCPRPKLLVWRGALADGEIFEAFRHPNWPIRLYAGMPTGPSWNWRVRSTTDGEPIADEHLAEVAIVQASAAKGPPIGNVLASIEIRDYQDRASSLGGLQWWNERENKVGSDPFVPTLISKISEVLRRAREQSIDLYIEKLSIVLAKDPTAPLATHLPLLHSDLYYGVRETAICSILEYGFNSFGGTIFLPTLNMKQLKPLGPLCVHDVYQVAKEHPIVQSGSSDLVAYDGMIAGDGVARDENGVPHISPDVPGRSARLVMLLRMIRLQ